MLANLPGTDILMRLTNQKPNASTPQARCKGVVYTRYYGTSKMPEEQCAPHATAKNWEYWHHMQSKGWVGDEEAGEALLRNLSLA